jgi:hypothetical protein
MIRPEWIKLDEETKVMNTPTGCVMKTFHSYDARFMSTTFVPDTFVVVDTDKLAFATRDDIARSVAVMFEKAAQKNAYFGSAMTERYGRLSRSKNKYIAWAAFQVPQLIEIRNKCFVILGCYINSERYTEPEGASPALGGGP